MALNEYNYTVIGMIASEVNVLKKTCKVRIPQYHGLPNNPLKVDYYVKDKDLPTASIIIPLGSSLELLKETGKLAKNTIVYLQFSSGELSHPLIIGWANGSKYRPTASISDYALLDDSDGARPAGNSNSGGVYIKGTGNPGEVTSTGFIIPFEGAILSWGFAPYDPFYDGWHRHGGIDLAGKPGGTPIYSITDSVVTFKFSNDWSMGNSIWANGQDLDGNTIQIQYMHMSDFAEGISVGDTLAMGDLVGYLGTTGSSTGVHLHLGIRYIYGKDGQHINEYYDPARILGVSDWISPYEWYYDQPGS